eukprot:550302-Karenia_brevis.AAC.1
MREREATESSSSTFVPAESRPVGAPKDYKEEIKDESKMELDENESQSRWMRGIESGRFKELQMWTSECQQWKPWQRLGKIVAIPNQRAQWKRNVE